MPTPHANENLTAYLDGELTDAELSHLENLLQSDAELRAELQALEEATEYFRTHAPIRAPDHFLGNVLALVEHEPVAANNNGWWRRPFGIPIEGIAVAAVAMLVVSVTMTNGSGGQSSPQVEAHNAAMAQRTKDADTVRQAPETQAAPEQLAKASPTKRQNKVASASSGNSKADSTAKSSTAGIDTATGDLAKNVIKSAYDSLNTGSGTDADTPSDATVPDTESMASKKQSPKMHAVYSYTISSDNPEVMQGLLRAASKHRGSIEDERGRGVGGDAMDGLQNGSFLVHLPAAALAEFGDELRSLGQVTQVPSKDWFGSETAKVRVNIEMTGE